jgi:putative flippase GtrA
MLLDSKWRELLPYAALSSTTLFVDVFVFAVLTASDVPAFAANFVSSATAAFCLYVTSSMRIFRRKPNLLKGFIFLSWYGTATLFWSLLIGIAANLGEIPAIYWKLIFTPLSFLANYLFSRRLIRGKGQS